MTAHDNTCCPRKFTLVLHVISSVSSLGAVACFLALGLFGLVSTGAETAQSPYVAMDAFARLVIVPLVFASLLTGLVQALGTTWDLFRHYWVLAKLLLTLLTAVVLLLQMDLICYVAGAAAKGIRQRTAGCSWRCAPRSEVQLSSGRNAGYGSAVDPN
ncbi:hypothetical protein [Sinorhizobium saheli]|uniref:hypothetical protein n=1 Tax=Sinorhizobium saheli TaxID=36856 RepID=UPI000ACAC556|nr:hypothetical protein [Sinorhizobium saheli]